MGFLPHRRKEPFLHPFNYKYIMERRFQNFALIKRLIHINLLIDVVIVRSGDRVSLRGNGSFGKAMNCDLRTSPS